MPRFLTVLTTLTISLPGLVWATDMTIQLDVDGQRVVGKPLSWSAKHMFLLTRDGALLDFNPSDATNFRKLSNRFCSFSQSEMRASLHREFGKRFDVSGRGHFLVVHPAGQRDLWAQRFEDINRAFTRYFSARGLRPHKPQFPLVAVVFHKRKDFVRSAENEGVTARSGLLGYYSPATNRVLLYDAKAGSASDDWHQNAETIIHEATHQMAFNTGIHSRFNTTPRWVAEGLGTMFEARGVWNPQRYTQREDRINRGRLESFRRYAAQRRPQVGLTRVLGNDDLFNSDADAAYAEAWAMTFFLAELEPHNYWRYLRKTTSRKSFTPYSSARRQKDFTDVFGQDLQMLDTRLLRFVKSL